VAKQRLKSPRARLFVALDLPGEVRDGLTAWQRRELEPIPVLRPIAPEALHVTLAFLGYLPEKQIDRIAAILDEVGEGTPAPELRFLPEPAARPPGSRPRLFAIEAESEGTIALQAEVSGRLERARLYEPEKRDFWPHVTVARTRRERRGSKNTARVDVRPRALPEGLCEPFRSVRLTNYRSILRPQGAEYVPLSSTDLKVSD
jgi:RNA 2',3'-cyclic 3'-phosphodiesterase